MATAVGGLLGCFLSGIMTQYFHPKYSFLSYSFMGLVVSLNAMFLTQESEQDHLAREEQSREEERINSVENSRTSQENEAAGFWPKLGANMRHIGQAMIMPEIYMVILFFVINGLISPDFGDFGYYFMLNVCQISKF